MTVIGIPDIINGHISREGESCLLAQSRHATLIVWNNEPYEVNYITTLTSRNRAKTRADVHNIS
jgi:hypothetical protein